MQFTNPACFYTTHEDASRPAWVQGRMSSGFGANGQRPGERFEIAFDIVKIDAALGRTPLLRKRGPERQDADAQRLRVALAVAEKTAAGFEEADSVLLAIEARAQRFDQAAEDCSPHHVELARDRVQHFDRIAVRPQRLLRCRAHEAEGDDFLIIAVDQALTHGRYRA